MQRVRERLGAAECANQHDLGSLLPLFDTASADLRYATDAALEDTMTWLIQQNKSRWSRSKEAVDEIALAASVAQLETAVEEYRSDGRKALTEPFRTFFDPKTGELKAHHPRHVAHGGSVEKDAPVFSPGSLFTLLSASDNLVLYSQAVLGLVKKVEGLQMKRTTNRLWFPTGLRKLGRLLSGGRPDKGLADGENPDKIEVVEEEGDDDDDETLHSQSGQKETPATKAKKGKAAEQSGGGGAFSPLPLSYSPFADRCLLQPSTPTLVLLRTPSNDSPTAFTASSTSSRLTKPFSPSNTPPSPSPSGSRRSANRRVC